VQQEELSFTPENTQIVCTIPAQPNLRHLDQRESTISEIFLTRSG
jgi:hypothetical protein